MRVRGGSIFTSADAPTGFSATRGLTDIHVDLAVHVHPVGHSRRPIFRDFVNNVRNALIDGGFIARDDLERDLALFGEKLADETVLMHSALYFLLRGRVPAGEAK
jgi:hypothetical protein